MHTGKRKSSKVKPNGAFNTEKRVLSGGSGTATTTSPPAISFSSPKKGRDKKAGKPSRKPLEKVQDPGKLSVPVQHPLKRTERTPSSDEEEDDDDDDDVEERYEYNSQECFDIIAKRLEEEKKYSDAPVRQEFADDLVENLTKQKLNMQLKGVADRMFQVLDDYERETDKPKYLMKNLHEEEEEEIDDLEVKANIGGIISDYKEMCYERERLLHSLAEWFAEEHMTNLITIIDDRTASAKKFTGRARPIANAEELLKSELSPELVQEVTDLALQKELLASSSDHEQQHEEEHKDIREMARLWEKSKSQITDLVHWGRSEGIFSDLVSVEEFIQSIDKQAELFSKLRNELKEQKRLNGLSDVTVRQLAGKNAYLRKNIKMLEDDMLKAKCTIESLQLRGKREEAIRMKIPEVVTKPPVVRDDTTSVGDVSDDTEMDLVVTKYELQINELRMKSIGLDQENEALKVSCRYLKGQYKDSVDQFETEIKTQKDEVKRLTKLLLTKKPQCPLPYNEVQLQSTRLEEVPKPSEEEVVSLTLQSSMNKLPVTSSRTLNLEHYDESTIVRLRGSRRSVDHLVSSDKYQLELKEKNKELLLAKEEIKTLKEKMKLIEEEVARSRRKNLSVDSFYTYKLPSEGGSMMERRSDLSVHSEAEEDERVDMYEVSDKTDACEVSRENDKVDTSQSDGAEKMEEPQLPTKQRSCLQEEQESMMLAVDVVNKLDSGECASVSVNSRVLNKVHSNLLKVCEKISSFLEASPDILSNEDDASTIKDKSSSQEVMIEVPEDSEQNHSIDKENEIESHFLSSDKRNNDRPGLTTMLEVPGVLKKARTLYNTPTDSNNSINQEQFELQGRHLSVDLGGSNHKVASSFKRRPSIPANLRDNSLSMVLELMKTGKIDYSSGDRKTMGNVRRGLEKVWSAITNFVDYSSDNMKIRRVSSEMPAPIILSPKPQQERSMPIIYQKNKSESKDWPHEVENILLPQREVVLPHLGSRSTYFSRHLYGLPITEGTKSTPLLTDQDKRELFITSKQYKDKIAQLKRLSFLSECPDMFHSAGSFNFRVANENSKQDRFVGLKITDILRGCGITPSTLSPRPRAAHPHSAHSNADTHSEASSRMTRRFTLSERAMKYPLLGSIHPRRVKTAELATGKSRTIKNQFIGIDGSYIRPPPEVMTFVSKYRPPPVPKRLPTPLYCTDTGKIILRSSRRQIPAIKIMQQDDEKELNF